MSVVEKSIEVDVPVRAAYDQWTQFEEFPEFMEGVEEVRQLDDVTLQWHVNISGVRRSFDARIEQQEPDRRVAWRALEGQDHAGVVEFEPTEDGRTLVQLTMNYEPEQWAEKVADFLNIIDNRVEGDLRRFKEFIEERGHETGGWRGRVEAGEVERDDPSPGTPPGGMSSPGGTAPAPAPPPPPGGTSSPGPTPPPVPGTDPVEPPPGRDLPPGGDPNLR